jgi:hypothetical protein
VQSSLGRPKFTAEKARERLAAGESLYPLEVALLAGGRVSRWRVVYHARLLGLDDSRTVGRQRLYAARDVRRLLDELARE